jgi:methyl-accepting chemotaxis protein
MGISPNVQTKWNSTMRIATRLLLSFGIFAVLSLTIALAGVFSSGDVNARIGHLAELRKAHDCVEIGLRGLAIRLYSGEMRQVQYRMLQKNINIVQTETAQLHSLINRHEKNQWGGYDSLQVLWQPMLDTIIFNAHHRDTLIAEGAMVEDQDIITIDGTVLFTLLQSTMINTESTAILDTIISGNTLKATQSAHMIKIIMLCIGFISLGLSILFAFTFARSIVVPIKKISSFLSDLSMSRGQLSARMSIQSRDEIGEISAGFNTFMEKLKSIIEEIRDTGHAMSSTSESLTNIAEIFGENAEKTLSETHLIVQSSNEASAQVRSIASTTEQMSLLIHDEADAIEKISSSIAEISRNCQQETTIAASAAEEARIGYQSVLQLSESAKEIGKIVTIITKIVDQTSLLALNAKIEAASAGAAGKGFAVVADEVKELARQTATSTHRIVEQIEQIQKNTSATVKTIHAITQKIDDLAHASQSIAGAIEEQNVTVRTVAQSITETSNSADSIVLEVDKSAHEFEIISGHIYEIENRSKSVSESINQTKTCANELTKRISGLEAIVKQFSS